MRALARNELEAVARAETTSAPYPPAVGRRIRHIFYDNTSKPGLHEMEPTNVQPAARLTRQPMRRMCGIMKWEA